MDVFLPAFVAGDNTIRIWNTASGDLLHTLEGHAEMVTSVNWSGDGRLASGSLDKQVFLWDVVARPGKWFAVEQ
jgi:WD40 repeat protein